MWSISELVSFLSITGCHFIAEVDLSAISWCILVLFFLSSVMQLPDRSFSGICPVRSHLVSSPLVLLQTSLTCTW